jgi:similar to spore coat protein
MDNRGKEKEMMQQGLAPNETMQLHEILTLKNLSLTKSITMSPLVSDEELKTILKNNIKITQQHIKELSGYLEQAVNAVHEDEQHS